MQGEIKKGPGGTIFTGGAVEIFRAAVIKTSLKLAAKGIRANSRIGPTQLLEAAGRITGKTYRRGSYDEAIKDLEAWTVEKLKTVNIEGGDEDLVIPLPISLMANKE